ncbi:MAG: glycosyl transferase, partial [Planctomycetota bacterium]|nr:glycosyl transferase [Planctomycetota bacterium]
MSLNPRPHLVEGQRVVVRGKFLYLAGVKFDVKGVTYGPFRPDADGCEYGDPARVESDFAGIVATGCNAVRVYTVPPRWLLNLAEAAGLRVMVGLPWEQHVTFLEDRSAMRRIVQSVRDGVRACAGHPAVLCFTVGNEIPASVVRYLGPSAVEQFLKR